MTDQSKIELQNSESARLEERSISREPSTSKVKKREAPMMEDCGLERLKRHRKLMAGSLCIPDTWGKESMLKEWTGFTSELESSLVPDGILLARQALVVACRHAE